MRPRVFPAEDRGTMSSPLCPHCGFNEAAGIPRGRRPASGCAQDGEAASMRPRVFPAEDMTNQYYRELEKELQ